MSYCPNCKATLGGKRLKCPECGHEREPEPEQEDQADGELKGWAAVYAPRKPANNAERMAAQLRQYAEGNFAGARPLAYAGAGRHLA
jgi:anaerobic ribonucleoside-triphosphate reductase